MSGIVWPCGMLCGHAFHPRHFSKHAVLRLDDFHALHRNPPGIARFATGAMRSITAQVSCAPLRQQVLTKKSELKTAIDLACISLKKQPGPAEAALEQRLLDNWYTTVGELVEMTEAEALALKCPLKLKARIAALLAENEHEVVQEDDKCHPGVADMTLTQQQLGEIATSVAAAIRPPAPATAPVAAVPATKHVASAAVPSSSTPDHDISSAAEPSSRPGRQANNSCSHSMATGSSSNSSSSSSSSSTDSTSRTSTNNHAALPGGAAQNDLAGHSAATASDTASAGSASETAAADTADTAMPTATPEPPSALLADLHPDIMQRRCPPLNRFSGPDVSCRDLYEELKVAQRSSKQNTYAIKEAQMTDTLKKEFAAFHRFLTTRFFGQQEEPIAAVTANKYADHVRCMLGWLQQQQGVPLDQLSFKCSLPSREREGVTQVFDYLQWLVNERGINVRTEALVIRSLISAAKFVYHSESKVKAFSGELPYSDLAIVQELRAMTRGQRMKAASLAPRASDESVKWLHWEEYLALVGELRAECAGLDHAGRPRKPLDVAMSLQRYLVFAILSCVPDRQRTIRELELGRTLVKTAQGRWTIRHGPKDYKTGKAYGERPPLLIAPYIYPELEAFISTWRAELKPQHNMLFSQSNGKPLAVDTLYKMFSRTALRLSGKKTNPHLVRDMIVTYLRGGSATEKEMEALAIYMGHSVAMQRQSYDRRTLTQKVEPAVELLETLNQRARAAVTSAGAGAAGVVGGGAGGTMLAPAMAMAGVAARQDSSSSSAAEFAGGGLTWGGKGGQKRASAKSR